MAKNNNSNRAKNNSSNSMRNNANNMNNMNNSNSNSNSLNNKNNNSNSNSDFNFIYHQNAGECKNIVEVAQLMDNDNRISVFVNINDNMDYFIDTLT